MCDLHTILLNLLIFARMYMLTNGRWIIERPQFKKNAKKINFHFSYDHHSMNFIFFIIHCNINSIEYTVIVLQYSLDLGSKYQKTKIKLPQLENFPIWFINFVYRKIHKITLNIELVLMKTWRKLAAAVAERRWCYRIIIVSIERIFC